MNIAIVGYGRMGKEVERIARERGHAVVACLDVGNTIDDAALKDAACCIVFTVPAAAVENIRAIAACRRNIIVGTTGWYDRIGEVEAVVRKADIGLLYSANFSIGVNLFFSIVREAARLFNTAEGYDAAVHEIHHRNKIDSPSGTAMSIGKIVLEEFKRKKKLLTEIPHEAIAPDALQISSTRTGTFTGTHEVTFDSPVDTIELRHTMKSRAGLAFGAVVAAEWLADRKGLYTFTDMLTT